jgi:hypothetical protein
MSALDRTYSGPGTPGGTPYGDMFPSPVPLAEPSEILGSVLNTTNTPIASRRGRVQDRLSALRREKSNPENLLDPELMNNMLDVPLATQLGDKRTHHDSDEDDHSITTHPAHMSDLKQQVVTIKSAKRFKPESVVDLDRLAATVSTQ